VVALGEKLFEFLDYRHLLFESITLVGFGFMVKVCAKDDECDWDGAISSLRQRSLDRGHVFVQCVL